MQSYDTILKHFHIIWQGNYRKQFHRIIGDSAD